MMHDHHLCHHDRSLINPFSSGYGDCVCGRCVCKPPWVGMNITGEFCQDVRIGSEIRRSVAFNSCPPPLPSFRSATTLPAAGGAPTAAASSAPATASACAASASASRLTRAGRPATTTVRAGRSRTSALRRRRTRLLQTFKQKRTTFKLFKLGNLGSGSLYKMVAPLLVPQPLLVWIYCY